MMQYLLLGGSGTLGSGFVDAIGRRPGRSVQRLAPPWGLPSEATRCVVDRVTALAGEARATTVVWAAGVGHVGAARATMAAEGAVLEGLCGALVDLPRARQQRTTLIFASSAGALFGGNDGRVISDAAEPTPISAYGREKLRQEQLCRGLGAQSDVRVLVCRYSNLYGLASGRLPGKGLIPAAITAARLRKPITLYVSADTRRDYVYAPDAAAASLALAEGLQPGAVAAALVARGTTTTVAEIVRTVGAILGRRVPVTFAVRAATALQPRTLVLAPREAAIVSGTSMPVAIHRMVHATEA